MTQVGKSDNHSWKDSGKTRSLFQGKLSVVYCVITWTCPPRRDSRNLGRKERYVSTKRIL